MLYAYTFTGSITYFLTLLYTRRNSIDRRGGSSSGRNKVSQTQDIYWSQTICFMRTLTILRQTRCTCPKVKYFDEYLLSTLYYLLLKIISQKISHKSRSNTFALGEQHSWARHAAHAQKYFSEYLLYLLSNIYC